MKTLQETLFLITKTSNISDDTVISFSEKFEEAYQNFVLDFVFSLEDNVYSVYNGAFISKIKMYFFDLFSMYYDDNSNLLLSSAFIYKFFVELEGNNNSHDYKVLTPLTIEDVTLRKNRFDGLNVKDIGIKYKNIKDIGNSALFMVLTAINSEFSVKFKDIEDNVRKYNLNFVFHKKEMEKSSSLQIENTIENILKQGYITSENLAIITFMQIFVMENVSHALGSIQTSPDNLTTDNFSGTLLGSKYRRDNSFMGVKPKANFLFPEVILKRGCIFNILLANRNSILENEYKLGKLSDLVIYFIELAFLETIKRYVHALSNPKENLEGLFNMFYRTNINNSLLSPNCAVGNVATLYATNLRNLGSRDSYQQQKCPELEIACLTKMGLTTFVEDNLPMLVINNQSNDLLFNASSLSDEITDALNSIVSIFSDYSDMTSVVNEFSIEILKIEMAAINTSAESLTNSSNYFKPPAILDDDEFLNNYYGAPFFIMDAITNVKQINKELLEVNPKNYLNRLKRVTSDITPFVFFLDDNEFEQVSYINSLLELEISSQILLLKYPEYLIILAHLSKFRNYTSNNGDYNIFEITNTSFLTSSMNKILLTATMQFLNKQSSAHSLFSITKFGNTPNSLRLTDISGIDFLINTFSPKIITEYPQVAETFDLIYKLASLSDVMETVFNEGRLANNKGFDDILVERIRVKVIDSNSVTNTISGILRTLRHYSNPGAINDSYLIPLNERTHSADEVIITDLISAINIKCTNSSTIKNFYFEESYGSKINSEFMQEIITTLIDTTNELKVEEILTSGSGIKSAITLLLNKEKNKSGNSYTEKLTDFNHANNIISSNGIDLLLSN